MFLFVHSVRDWETAIDAGALLSAEVKTFGNVFFPITARVNIAQDVLQVSRSIPINVTVISVFCYCLKNLTGRGRCGPEKKR